MGSYASVTIDLDQFYGDDDKLSLISLDEPTTTTKNTPANDHQEVEDEVIETIESIGFDCRVLLPNEELTQKKKVAPVQEEEDDDDDDDEEEYEDDGTIQVTYQVLGMSCTVCTTKVKRALLSKTYV